MFGKSSMCVCQKQTVMASMIETNLCKHFLS